MEKILDIAGRTHVSSSYASELTGYTNDYIGQLCRAGKVDGVIVGRTRFVDKESLLSYADQDHWAGKTLYTSLKDGAVANIKETLADSEVCTLVSGKTGVYGLSLPAVFFMTTFIIVVFAGMRIAHMWEMAGQAVIAGDMLATTSASIQTASSENGEGQVMRLGRQTNIFLAYVAGSVTSSFAESTRGMFERSTSLTAVIRANNESLGERFALAVYTLLMRLGDGVHLIAVRTLTGVLSVLGVSNSGGATTQGVMVVVPASVNESENEVMKDRIRKSFSDDVNVDVKSDGSGIITPVFKSGKEDRYMFVMVPVGK